ncbi:hypothetical protein TNCV_427701 [Trichonephila clavipes]|nr:hypothetical protein TNCV_427701 [Trichonephila clavipes]
MGKTTDPSPFQKELIVSAHFAGASIWMTVNLSGLSKTATSKVFKSWNQNLQSFSRRRNCGSSTVFQEYDWHRLRRIVRRNRDSTVLQLTQIFT